MDDGFCHCEARGGVVTGNLIMQLAAGKFHGTWSDHLSRECGQQLVTIVLRCSWLVLISLKPGDFVSCVSLFWNLFALTMYF